MAKYKVDTVDFFALYLASLKVFQYVYMNLQSSIRDGCANHSTLLVCGKKVEIIQIKHCTEEAQMAYNVRNHTDESCTVDNDQKHNIQSTRWLLHVLPHTNRLHKLFHKPYKAIKHISRLLETAERWCLVHSMGNRATIIIVFWLFCLCLLE